MLIPRRTQLEEAASDAQGPLNFHLWSTVAPSAHLGDTDFKTWMQQLLKRLGLSYAVQMQGFALADGQFHLILQWTPGAAAQWDDEEVRSRWLTADGVTCNSSAAFLKLRWRAADSKVRKVESGGRR